MAKPARHPDPPVDLHRRPLLLKPGSGTWLRIHRHPSPVYFGKTLANRFDDPLGAFGVLYVGLRFDGAFVEVYGSRVRYKAVSLKALQDAKVSELVTSRPALLVDLTGPGLKRLGADSRLCNGPHALSQKWSRALHEHPEVPDGLLYFARHDPSRHSVALFERFEPWLSTRPSTELLLHPDLRGALRRYGLGILP